MLIHTGTCSIRFFENPCYVDSMMKDLLGSNRIAILFYSFKNVIPLVSAEPMGLIHSTIPELLTSICDITYGPDMPGYRKTNASIEIIIHLSMRQRGTQSESGNQHAQVSNTIWT